MALIFLIVAIVAIVFGLLMFFYPTIASLTKLDLFKIHTERYRTSAFKMAPNISAEQFICFLIMGIAIAVGVIFLALFVVFKIKANKNKTPKAPKPIKEKKVKLQKEEKPVEIKESEPVEEFASDDEDIKEALENIDLDDEMKKQIEKEVKEQTLTHEMSLEDYYLEGLEGICDALPQIEEIIREKYVIKDESKLPLFIRVFITRLAGLCMVNNETITDEKCKMYNMIAHKGNKDFRSIIDTKMEILEFYSDDVATKLMNVILDSSNEETKKNYKKFADALIGCDDVYSTDALKFVDSLD